MASPETRILPPPLAPDDEPDTEMSLEWLDDDMWALPTLDSASPNFSSHSVTATAAPCLGTDEGAVSYETSPVIAERLPSCNNAHKTQGSCVGVITGILGSMRYNSTHCLMGTHELPSSRSVSSPSSSGILYATTTATSVDSVLSTALEAARRVRGLFECPTCRTSPQFQLLLTVAFAEMIAAYRRVISTYHHHGHVKEPKPHEQQQQQHCADDDLRRAPLSIGSHRIEGSMETVLVGRVISCRLRELEAVMGEMLQPASVAQPEGSGAAEAGRSSRLSSTSRLLRELYIGRDSFLAEQLGAARQELTGLLHHGTGDV